MKYQESDYFNDKDYFIIFVPSLNKFYVTKCHWYNGSWYSDVALKFKMTSVLSLSAQNIIGRELNLKNTELKGVIGKVMSPNNVGIVWNQGQHKEFKKYGFPYYWNNINDLEL
jgi:hypothetical protein